MMVSWISLRDRCDNPQIQLCSEGMSYCTLFRQLNGCLHETVVNIFSSNFQAWNIIDYEAHSGMIDQSVKSVVCHMHSCAFMHAKWQGLHCTSY